MKLSLFTEFYSIIVQPLYMSIQRKTYFPLKIFSCFKSYCPLCKKNKRGNNLIEFIFLQPCEIKIVICNFYDICKIKCKDWLFQSFDITNVCGAGAEMNRGQVAHGPQILVWATKLLPIIQLNIQTFFLSKILYGLPA